MSAIGSRFNSLLINASDPFEVKDKKSTKAKKTKKQVPKTAESKPVQINKETSVPVVPISIKDFKKSSKVIVTDLTPKKDIVEKPIEFSPDIVNEDFIDNKPDDNFEASKDDRGQRERSTYKKMMVSGEGRIYDRHGGNKTRVKPAEKRQGHGAFNWGDIVESESQVVEENTNIKIKVEEPVKPEIPQITIGQYKELIKEKIVDPTSWEHELQNIELNQQNQSYEDDTRIYEYRREDRPYRSSNSRGRNRRNPRGRGDDYYNKNQDRQGENEEGQDYPRGGGRGFRRNNRGFRGSRNNRGQGGDRDVVQTPQLNEIKVDNINEFPEL